MQVKTDTMIGKIVPTTKDFEEVLVRCKGYYHPKKIRIRRINKPRS